jgi:hypothetical protein
MGNPVTARRTFAEYAAMDPRISELLQEAKRLNRTTNRRSCHGFALNNCWYKTNGGLKGRIKQLVGYYRDEPPNELGTPEAYSVVSRTVFSALMQRNDGDDWCGHG